MGASAREIERQIKETRERMDANITRLEGTAADRAMRYGKWAALGVGAVVLAGAAFLVYRRTRKPALRERIDDLSSKRIRELLERVREEFPSVTVRVNEKSEPGMLESTLRKAAHAIVGTASTAVLQRLVRPPASEPSKS